jgi:uncharacterized membrane protein YfcA
MLKDIVLLLAGCIVGGMNAIAGGGMLVGFPVLIALGLPAIFANATAPLAVLPGQLTSAIGYREYLRKVPRRFALLLIPTVVGAAGGSLALRHTSAGRFADIVPLLLLLGVILFTAQPLLHFHLHSHVKDERSNWLPMVLLGIAMVPVNFYGGYFGAGYGFIMLAFLGLTNLPDTHMMNGMKNVAATFVATTSIICLYSSGLIHWRTGLVMAAGSTIGGYAGSRYAQRFSNQRLRYVIIGIGLVAVAYLALRQY